MKTRLDQLLVDKSLAPSKTKAQEMILSGQVTLVSGEGGSASATVRVAKKPSQLIDATKVNIVISKNNLLKYVSRAGFKLDGALKRLNLDVSGFNVLDVGQSTGGFTDCLLQRGAAFVVGVDVAKGELAKSLIKHPQVVSLTGINARDLSKKKLPQLKGKAFDLAVVDVSFISLDKILPGLIELIRSKGHLLALVKPQFEVGSVNLSKKGIPKSPMVIEKAKEAITDLARRLGLLQIDFFTSELKGRDGNQEYFIYGKKK